MIDILTELKADEEGFVTRENLLKWFDIYPYKDYTVPFPEGVWLYEIIEHINRIVAYEEDVMIANHIFPTINYENEKEVLERLLRVEELFLDVSFVLYTWFGYRENEHDYLFMTKDENLKIPHKELQEFINFINNYEDVLIEYRKKFVQPDKKWDWTKLQEMLEFHSIVEKDKKEVNIQLLDLFIERKKYNDDLNKECPF